MQACLVVQLQRRLREAEHALLLGHLRMTTRQTHEVEGRHGAVAAACESGCWGTARMSRVHRHAEWLTLGAWVTSASSCCTAAATASPAQTAGS